MATKTPNTGLSSKRWPEQRGDSFSDIQEDESMTRESDQIIDYTQEILRRPDNDAGPAGRDTGERVLRDSRGADAAVTERSGIDPRYLDKRGTPSGEDALLLHLPPGMNIEDQSCSRADEAGEIPFKRWNGKDYVAVGSANGSTRKGK
jgi:hypothetical protein